jgi:hypothetical protein
MVGVIMLEGGRHLLTGWWGKGAKHRLMARARLRLCALRTLSRLY